MSSTPEVRAVAQTLDAAGVPADATLFVHSAFRNLSAHGYRAEAFIEKLLARLSGGTLVMPTMSWRIVTPAQPAFDELTTPSHVGVLAEIFRQRFATHRSLHPTHSVAARGVRAAELTSGHHLDDTPCSHNSPYGRAVSARAHILMLGVGLERCTAIHCAEETVAPDIYLNPRDATELYQCRDRHGQMHEVRLRRHLKLNRDFPQFTRPMEAAGKLRRGELAGTPWMAFAQADLLDEVVVALERNPQAIIAAPGAPVMK